MTPADHRLAGLLAPSASVLVALGPWTEPADLPAALTRAGITHRELTEEPWPATDPAPEAVVVVVRDRAALRAVVGACRALPASTRLGCVLLRGDQPPLTAGHPSWPRVRSLAAVAGPPCFTFAELDAELDAGRFVADLARRLTPRHLMSAGWPVIGTDRAHPQTWTAGDPTSVVGDRDEIGDTDTDYPPDVLLVDAASGPAAGPDRGDHHVLGPLVDDVRLESLMTWSDYHGRGTDAGDRALAAEGRLGLGGLDGHVLNPTGFLRAWKEPFRTLEPVPSSPSLCRLETSGQAVTIDTRQGIGEVDVSRLRALEGVHLPWRGASGPRDYCRLVVALAMAGVPLTCEPVPSWAHALIDRSVLEAITAPLDQPGDSVAREVRSIRLRRAAHATHGLHAWRDDLATRYGLQRTPRPRVSILLPTRRPDLLRFALRQVGRQRGVDLELVLATHGHEPDPGALEDLARTSQVEVTPLRVPADRRFGDLLNDAADRASGDLLLKMDDDDWYGPDFVSDLLLARAYSGADVVGCSPEFVFVEPLDVTVRRRSATETFHPVVAGGTMLISRPAHEAVGGFRSMQRSVDAGFLQAVSAAGGSIYRTHGHSYLLRRTSAGHTWDPGLGYFVSRSRSSDQWRGFRPSPLLEPDQADVPGGTEPTDA